LVVGFVFELGAQSSWLESFLKDVPANFSSPSKPVNLRGVYPRSGSDVGKFVQYTGSLTTPPCLEGVEFHIFTAPLTLSFDQLSKLSSPARPTNRAIQSLNSRVVHTNVCSLNCNNQKQHCHFK